MESANEYSISNQYYSLAASLQGLTQPSYGISGPKGSIQITFFGHKNTEKKITYIRTKKTTIRRGKKTRKYKIRKE